MRAPTATSRITTKGQITLPKRVREALGLGAGSLVGFEVKGRRAVLTPLALVADDATAAQDWPQLEKLVRSRGRRFASAAAARKHLERL